VWNSLTEYDHRALDIDLACNQACYMQTYKPTDGEKEQISHS